MIRKICLLGLSNLFLTLAVQAAGNDVHWTYEGTHGPEHWGELSEDFVQCRVGLNQSPVDINSTIDADLPPLVLDYNGYTTELINKGHTGQANVEPGSFLRVDGQAFELVQLHLHTPSEHQIEGKQFLMEVHLVHQNESGELAVVAMLYDEGTSTREIEQYNFRLPADVGRAVPYRQPLSDFPAANAPDIDYYRYNGSLTTPPCSEGVRWFVLKDINTTTREQQAVYKGLIGDDARGPQPQNARIILR
ncbi:MAG: carbonic anhydrase family protein [Halioglobus sp.]